MNNDQKYSGLALFDLDGTLLPWDTQLLFSNFILHKQPWRRFLFIPFLIILPFFVFGIVSESFMKRLYLGYLASMRKDKLDMLVNEFSKECVLPWCYTVMLDRLKKHREEGFLCILVTASPSVYALAVGHMLDFHQVISTDILSVDRVPFFPKMPFGNNKGEVKVSRLREMGYLPPKDHAIPDNSIAYSDSSADLPMLQACRSAVLVNPSRKLSEVRHTSWETVHPSCPWSSPLDKILQIIQQFIGIYPIKPFKK